MMMRLWIAAALLTATLVRAQEACKLWNGDEEIIGNILNIALDDDEFSYELKIRTEHTDNGVLESDPAKTIYFKGEWNVPDFDITLTTEFQQLEQNEPSQINGLSLAFSITFNCLETSNTRKLDIFANIVDKPSPPFFESSSSGEHLFTIPLPLPKSLELYQFGTQIVGIDWDITNTGMTFTFEPDNGVLQVETVKDPDDSLNKRFLAKVTTKQVITAAVPDIVIVAKDSGNLEARSTLKFNIDTENSVPQPPIFDQAVYTVLYTVTDGQHAISNVPIKITGAGSVDIEPNDNFKIDPTGTADLYQLTLETNLEQNVIDENIFLSLTIIAITEGSTVQSTAGIIISLPEKEIPPVSEPVFSDPQYTGQFDYDTQIVTLDEAITVTHADVVTIDLTGTYEQHFEVDIGGLPNVLINARGDPLPPNLPESFLSFVMHAKNAAAETLDTTGIAIGLPTKSDAEPVFNKRLYTGKYDYDATEVELEEPIVATPTDVANIELIGTYAEHFEVDTSDWNNLKIKSITANPLPSNLPDTFLSFLLQAKNAAEDVLDSTAIAIGLPQSDPPVAGAVFDSTIYSGQYDYDATPPTVIWKQTIRAESPDFQSAELTGEHSQHFLVDFSNPLSISITVNAADPLPEGLTVPFVLFWIKALDADNLELDRSALVVGVPSTGVVNPAEKIFVETYTVAQYIVDEASEHHMLQDATIEMTEQPSSIELLGEPSSKFEYEINGQQLLIKIATDLEIEFIKANKFLQYEVIARTADNEDKATLIIGLPTIKTPPILTFDNFRTSIGSSMSGIIGKLSARSTDVNDVITYDLDDTYSWLSLVNGNELQVAAGSQPIPPDTYVIQARATATGVGGVLTDVAVVQINVITASTCGAQARTDFAVITKTVPEEDELAAASIVPLNKVVVTEEGVDKTYYFQIVNQVPCNPDIAMSIKGSDDNLHLSSPTLDREAKIGWPYDDAQISIEVELIEADSNPSPGPACTFSTTYHPRRQLRKLIGLPEEVPNLHDRTTIVVIIQDVNDNTPTFGKIMDTVAYPVRDIVADISPRYLTQVVATDDDIGDNAKITYTTTSRGVTVHPDTGILYATDDLYNLGDDDIVIEASDSINSAELVIKLKIINDEHISVMTLDGVMLEGLGAKLEELSTAANVEIKTFAASVVPKPAAAKAGFATSDDLYLYAIVYAVDAQDIITSTSLEQKLAGLAAVGRYVPGKIVTFCDDECDDTGLIAGVSVLGVLLAIALVGFLFFFIYRARRNKASIDLELAPEYVSPKKIDDIHHFPMKSEFGSTPKENGNVKDDVDSISSLDSMDEAQARERRKSVTFNARIQNFEIEKDAESKTGEEESQKDKDAE